MHIFCRFFGHNVVKRNVLAIGGDHLVRCGRCSTMLVRHGPGDWRPQGELASAAVERG